MQSCDLQTKCKIVDRLLNICPPDHPMNQNLYLRDIMVWEINTFEQNWTDEAHQV